MTILKIAGLIVFIVGMLSIAVGLISWAMYFGDIFFDEDSAE